MSVTPELLLDAATAIAKGSSEVDWRNAASRAYYAAYHRCRTVALEAKVEITETGGVHNALVNALTAPLTSRPLKSLGYMLEQCRHWRTAADYRIDQDFSRDLADSVLASCRSILKKADDLSAV